MSPRIPVRSVTSLASPLSVSTAAFRPRAHARVLGVAMLAALGSAAWGCSSGDTNSSEQTGVARASLHRAKSCPDLLSDLKADAAYKVKRSVDLQIKQIRQCQSQTDDKNCVYVGYGYGGGGGFSNDASEAPTAGSPGPSKGESGNDRASSHSETNTQVAGVDEADIVKTDGANIYLLHGSAFKILKAWPANEMSELATLAVEGTPTEMFVEGDKAVIYSTVNGANVYSAAGVTPKATYQDYGYATNAGGMARDASEPNAGSPQVYVPLTKITVLTLTGNVPTVARELYFEGDYLDSRRVDSHVRTVLAGYAHGPRLKYGVWELLPNEPNAYPQTGTAMISLLEKLRSENLSIIAASQLSDWIPSSFVKEGAQVTARAVACEDFYVPNAGSTTSGFTEVASIDLANPTALPKETAILGRVDNVYGSAKSLYLAANAWVEPPFVWTSFGPSSGGGVSGSPGVSEPAPPPDSAPAPEDPAGSSGARPANFGGGVSPKTTPGEKVLTWSTSQTHVHKFEFDTDPTFANYVASGTVPGLVKNQFSMDDKDGQLRIATTESRLYTTASGEYVSPSFDTSTPNPVNPNTVNHLYVLGLQSGWLETVGDVGVLAPNEQIYSARFLGNRGYVVTFRQVDPLFVIDLSQPTAPKVLAALKIPGFSEYMHPLDENHLLTIGRNADNTGRQRGLQLQIFDVTDGANPIQQNVFTYDGSEYGSSDAEYDHKAFTYFADKKLLAFPYYTYGQNGMRSSLEVFRVDASSGFTKLGSLDHTALLTEHPNGYCGGYYGPSVRRGLFLDNVVYSVSYAGVVAKDIQNFGAAGNSLALGAPTTDPTGGYGAPPCEKY